MITFLRVMRGFSWFGLFFNALMSFCYALAGLWGPLLLSIVALWLSTIGLISTDYLLSVADNDAA